MKSAAVYGLLALMLVLTGCPAQTDNPVDNGSYAVPSWLPGKWKNYQDGKMSHYILEKRKEKGQFTCYSLDSTGAKKVEYDPVILSKVGKQVFVSAMSVSSYFLFRLIQVNDTEFKLEEVDDSNNDSDILPASSSAEIFKFLSANKDGDIYGDTYTYNKE
jgi:hypothetical protein